LTWTWSDPTALPIAFDYTLNVPADSTGAQLLSASLDARLADSSTQHIAMIPAPLVVNQLSTHSADTDHDYQLSLFELTRVIELYNTRNGTSRTGSYRVNAEGEDGFSGDSARPAGSATPLTHYHSADTRGNVSGSPHDGAIDLFELTRVIELYNTRSGTSRTGRYHVQLGTEDGFAPGP
jgi:hypothetical protein